MEVLVTQYHVLAVSTQPVLMFPVLSQLRLRVGKDALGRSYLTFLLGPQVSVVASMWAPTDDFVPVLYDIELVSLALDGVLLGHFLRVELH